MNRNDLQALSRMRQREAKVLLDAGNYAGSYYLMGYAIECAVKAAIAKQTKRYDFPDKKHANDSFSHDLKALLQVASLWHDFDTAMKATPSLALNWAVVKDWNERSRYMTDTTQRQAVDLHSACTARTHGILSWLKQYW